MDEKMWMRARSGILDLNMMFWTLLKSAACIKPKTVSKQFNLSHDAVKRIADLQATDIQTISSGVVLSFVIDVNENAFIDSLNTQSSVPTINSFEEDRSIDEVYWQLMAQVAMFNTKFTTQIFGVSEKLACKIASTPDNTIKHSAKLHSKGIYIRMSTSLLDSVLKDKCLSRNVEMKKLQQALCMRSKGITNGYEI